MTGPEAARILRRHVGHVRVAVLARDDVYYVRAYRDDAAEAVERMSDGQVEVTIRDGIAYVDRGD
jgi:hypothetical protein